jgi:hypothetical protein
LENSITATWKILLLLLEKFYYCYLITTISIFTFQKPSFANNLKKSIMKSTFSSVLSWVLLFHICSAESDEAKGRWCNQFTYDCPVESRAAYLPPTAGVTIFDVSQVPLTNQYICMGPYTVTCTDVGKKEQGGCFGGDSLVYRSDGSPIFIKDLKVGDVILNGTSQPNKVLGWIHREPETVYPSILLNGLEVSAEHLVMTEPGKNPLYKFVGHLSQNDTLWSGSNDISIKVPIKTLKNYTSVGLYAPYTESGTILVNNISFSCYAAFNDHDMAHAFMSVAYVIGGLHTTEKESYVPVASFMKRALSLVQYYAPNTLY